MQNSPEDRIEALAGEMARLKGRLDRLEANLASFAAWTHQPEPSSGEPAREGPAAKHGQKEEPWEWLGRASLLPRFAAVSFVLVLALLLRTLTDANMIDPYSGSYLGLAYAILLLILGRKLLVRRRPLAPVMLVCGAVFIFLITLESHSRFNALSSVAAYIILLAALGALVVMANRHQFPLLGTLGLLGAGVAGFGIDFPNPSFPLFAIYLLIAGCAAYLVSNHPPYRETGRWGIFLLTCLFWVNWVMKSGSSGYDFGLFISFLILHQVIYFLMTIHRVFGLGRLSLLDCLLPTAGGLFFYLAARPALLQWLDQSRLIGAAGLIWSALLFLVAVLAVHTINLGSKAVCAFTFAGAALLLLAIPDLTASILLSLPLWSLGALFLIRLSGHCEAGGIRFASYLLQVTASIAGIASGSFALLSGNLPLSLAVAGAITFLSGLHYRTSRRRPLNCSAGLQARIDPRDRTAMALLLVTLVNGFCALQLGAAMVLAGMPIDPGTAIRGLQSVILNGGALLLLIAGLRYQNSEVLAMALAVFIGGAGKVFGYDLFVLNGIPLMLSVFSFGTAAALGSMVLSRRKSSGGFRHA